MVMLESELVKKEFTISDLQHTITNLNVVIERKEEIIKNYESTTTVSISLV